MKQLSAPRTDSPYHRRSPCARNHRYPNGSSATGAAASRISRSSSWLKSGRSLCTPSKAGRTSAGLVGEVVEREQRLAAPVVAQSQHAGLGRVEDLASAPADLGRRAAGADEALHVLHERAGHVVLGGDVDAAVIERLVRHHRPDQLVRGRVREAGARLVRPLHRRAHGVALRQREVVAHADLVAVPEDGRAGQGEHQAEGELQAPLVAAEHGARGGGARRARRPACASPGRRPRRPRRAPSP